MTLTELQALTDQKFDMIATDPADDSTIMFAVPIPGADHLHYEKDENGAYIIDPIEDWIAAWEDYIATLQGEPKRTYRTRRLAGKTDTLPKDIPIITLKPWEAAMSLKNDKNAHLLIMSGDIKEQLKYEEEKLYYQGAEISQIELDAKLYVYSTTEGLQADTDLQPLRYLYGVILNKYGQNIEDIAQRVTDDARQFLSHNITIYMPDYARAIGLPSNINQDNIRRMVKKISDYSSIWGVIETKQGGRIRRGYYPVMSIVAYEESDNTLTFTSPYMNRIIVQIIQDSIKKDKLGNPVRRGSGSLVTKPNHTHHGKATLVSEGNSRAVDIIHRINKLLDQAGDTYPHIKFATIVEEVESLKRAIEAAPDTSRKNRILKRTFTRAWELLPIKTDVKDKFRDIQLPDPKNPKNIPTMKTLQEVIAFPHKGKIKQSEKWAKPQ